jgi:hypothetical protein
MKSIQIARPFGWVALAWLALGLLFSFAFGHRELASLGWMFGIWALSVIDLAVLARLLAALGSCMTDESPSRKSAHVFQALFWAGAKVACLGFFLLVLMNARGAPTASLLSGMGTLLVVPLLGGYGWSQSALSEVTENAS